MAPEDLKARREAIGLTQVELARSLDVPYPTLYRWETGKMTIRHPRVLQLALERLADQRPRSRHHPR